VRLYHPDLNPDDESSLARVKEINQAYEVLSDPAARIAYDRELEAEEARRRASMTRRPVIREYHRPDWGFGSPYADGLSGRSRRTRVRRVWAEDLPGESFSSPFASDFFGGLDDLFTAVDRLMRRMESLDAEVQANVERAYRRL